MALTGLVVANNLSDVVDRERAWDNLGSSLVSGDIAIPAPSLDLNFAANKSLVDDISGNNLITFSRASTGTFVGSNGLIQTAASGVPRFDHNPATGESLGLLMEASRTNFYNYSENFNDIYWVKTNASIESNVTIAPDGALSMDKLIPDTSGNFGRLSKTLTAGIAVDPSCTSIFLKADGYNYVRILFNDGLNQVAVDLTNGTATYVGTSVESYEIKSAGNGIYRVSIVLADGANQSFYNIIPLNQAQTGFSPIAFTGDGVSGIFVWGAQIESFSHPTSYIPTIASTVTRAADVASITGANFSGWYNQSEGTLLTKVIPALMANLSLWTLSDGTTMERMLAYSASAFNFYVDDNSINQVNIGGFPFIVNSVNVSAAAYKLNNFNYSRNGSIAALDTSGSVPTPNRLQIMAAYDASGVHTGTIARLVYWQSRLSDKILQYITQLSATSFSIYSFSFAIKGRDVLALEDVRNTSTRDFIFIKGLLSAAQPRFTATAASTASGIALASNALLKLAPVSSGNYFFASGLTLSGVTTRINGTNALSIATSPFSGSTATAPLLFRELRPQANWRITEPMPSGTIATPDLAIPFETNDFVLFMKAGQN